MVKAKKTRREQYKSKTTGYAAWRSFNTLDVSTVSSPERFGISSYRTSAVIQQKVVPTLNASPWMDCDRRVAFLFKHMFWKETLMSGKWCMRHRGHQSSVLSVSRGRWSKLSHRGVLDWHLFRCSRCLCAEPTEVTWVKVEPGRGTQVTSKLLFKLSDQVSFPGMFHWHCSRWTLVFDRIHMKGNRHHLLWSL